MMRRAVGLFMIALGALGLGASLVDWQNVEGLRSSNTAPPETIPAGESTDGGATSDDDVGQPADTIERASVTENDAAAVKLFEQEDRLETSGPRPSADVAPGSEIVDEDAGHADFLVTLSEPAERPIVIIFSTIDLSADDGEDYRSQRGTLTFKPGMVSAEIRTPLVDDEIKEDDEQFAIILNGAPEVVDVRNRRATATIRDND